MGVRNLLALILIFPATVVFWLVTLFEVLFYPYTAIVVGLLANGRWISFQEYLDKVIGEPFGG